MGGYDLNSKGQLGFIAEQKTTSFGRGQRKTALPALPVDRGAFVPSALNGEERGLCEQHRFAAHGGKHGEG